MNNTTRNIIFVCGFAVFILFAGLVLAVVNAQARAARAETGIAILSVTVTKQNEQILHHEQEIGKLTERLHIIEESVDSKDKRAATIRQVRKAITDTLRVDKIVSKFNSSELTSMASTIIDASEEFDIPKNLILGIMRQESAFNPKAVSPVGARGLMQLMIPTAKECALDLDMRNFEAREQVFNIRHNIRFGTHYIWKMLHRFNGNLDLAVRAYNAGPTLVEKVSLGEIDLNLDCDGNGAEESPYPCETMNYVKKVLEYKKRYENLGL